MVADDAVKIVEIGNDAVTVAVFFKAEELFLQFNITINGFGEPRYIPLDGKRAPKAVFQLNGKSIADLINFLIVHIVTEKILVQGFMTADNAQQRAFRGQQIIHFHHRPPFDFFKGITVQLFRGFVHVKDNPFVIHKVNGIADIIKNSAHRRILLKKISFHRLPRLRSDQNKI